MLPTHLRQKRPSRSRLEHGAAGGLQLSALEPAIGLGGLDVQAGLAPEPAPILLPPDLAFWKTGSSSREARISGYQNGFFCLF